MARRRSRRGDDGLLINLIDAAAMIPWWISVPIAVGLYFILHKFAIAQIAPPKNINALSGVIVSQVFRTFAMIGQYVLPGALLLGAAISFFRQPRTPKSNFEDWADSSASSSAGNYDSSEIDLEPNSRLESALDLLWKSSLQLPKSSSLDTSRWSLKLLQTIEWKRFEEVCSGLFQRLGFETKTTRCGADGGVDIHLFREGSKRADVVVQCKAWNIYKVGIKPLRELLGVMTSSQVGEGIFVTTGTFTKEAQEFGKANRIDCLDGTTLLKALQALPKESQDELLRRATAGDYLTPSCASCGIKLVERQPKSGGKAFWGCLNYPRCRLTLKVRNEG